MHIDLLLTILFELLQKRRVTAADLARRYNLSTRTIYRYIEKLSAFLPLYIKRGRTGGICLADSYRLPVGFLSETEYGCILQALQTAYDQTGERAYLLTRKKFLSQRQKEELPAYIAAAVGEITLLPNEYGVEEFPLLYTLQTCVKEKRVTELLLIGEKYPQTTEPTSLILQQGKWSLLAFFREERNFLTLPLTSIRGAKKTEEVFEPRSFHFALPVYGTKGNF